MAVVSATINGMRRKSVLSLPKFASRNAPLFLVLAALIGLAVLALELQGSSSKVSDKLRQGSAMHTDGHSQGDQTPGDVQAVLGKMHRKLEAALAKRMAKMEKSLLAVENKLNIALEDLSDSSEQTRDQLQKAPTVRAFQSPTKPTFRVATYAADADINGWITYDDVHWRLIRRYFLERQRAKPQLYERAGAKLVVDAGCNHGTYSLFAAAHGYRVLCFEINPELSKLVEQSKALNPATGYLISVQTLGVGAARETRPFNPEGGGTFLRPVARKGAGELEAHIHLLDDFAFEPFVLLKIDVEGFEVPALQGSKLAIQQYGVGAILIEIGPARWDRGGVTLDQGYEVLAWVISAGEYDAFVLLRNGGTCPEDAIRKLAVGADGGSRLQMQRRDDVGTEALGGRALWLPEPLEDSLLPLLRAMGQNDWDCNFWLEKKTPME